MKSIYKWLGLGVAALGIAGKTHAISYNLGSLISSGNSISIGDKIFDDFNFTSSQFDPASATVIPSVDAAGVYYLTLTGPFVTWGGSSAGFEFGYSVATSSGQNLITSIDQSFVLSAGGTGGTIDIQENAHTGSPVGSVVANSALSFASGNPPTIDLEDPSAESGDDLLVDLGSNKLFIVTEVAFASLRGGIVGPSVISQSFHQSPQMVDETGATALLLGSALFGVGYFRRKLR